MSLLVVLLSGGCEIDEMSPDEESRIVLASSVGFIPLSWPVVILLTLLGRRFNLVRNRVVLLQYFFFVVIQIIISLRIGIWGDLFIVFLMLLAITLFAIPYLLLVGGLLILVLPVRLLPWVPSFLLLLHYLVYGLLFLTNNEQMMSVNPVVLMAAFAVELWYVAMPVGVAIFVGLLIRRRREEGK
jgi:hypothetical protein